MAEGPWITRRLLCDWQQPEFLDEVTLDVERFVDKAVEVGAQSLDMVVKSAFGNCLYPSTVGRTNRAMKGNIFGDLCRLAKKRGLEIFAYYNMLLDDALGAEHPEWLQRDAGGTALKFEHYAMFCMNAAPYRDRVYAHIAEIAELHPVDGIMLDIQYWHGTGCYCAFCRERFRSETGHALDPAAFTPDRWHELYACQSRWRREYILGAVDHVERTRPGLKWVWNASGNFSDNTSLDARLSHYGTEAHPPAYDLASAKAKWIRASGKPFVQWMPESIGSWGHFSLTTPATLKAMCAISMANGGTIGINHVAPACGDYAGRVFPGVYKVLGEVMGWMKEREELCASARTVPVVAVLHSVENTRIARTRAMALSHAAVELGDRALGQQNSVTTSRLLDEIHVTHDLLHAEETLQGPGGRPFEDYEALILPNVGYLEPKAADRIRAWVKAGGKLLATYNTSLLGPTGEERDDFLLSDVLGIEFRSYSPYSLCYVDGFQEPLASALPELPLLIKDVGYQKNSPHRPIYCELAPGARAYATFTEPILESDWAAGRHIYHDHAPPGKRTKWPAVVVNGYGKGTAAFLPFPFVQAHEFQANPWYRSLMRTVLELLGAPRAVRIQAPDGVLTVATEGRSGWLLHVINARKETGSILIDDSVAPGPVRFSLRPPWPVSRVSLPLRGKTLPFDLRDGAVELTLESVRDHEIVEIAR
jgi:hypothetical protein